MTASWRLGFSNSGPPRPCPTKARTAPADAESKTPPTEDEDTAAEDASSDEAEETGDEETGDEELQNADDEEAAE